MGQVKGDYGKKTRGNDETAPLCSRFLGGMSRNVQCVASHWLKRAFCRSMNMQALVQLRFVRGSTCHVLDKDLFGVKPTEGLCERAGNAMIPVKTAVM
jgi:hypothetical protein